MSAVVLRRKKKSINDCLPHLYSDQQKYSPPPPCSFNPSRGRNNQLCARESAMAEKAVPESLGDIFGHPEKLLSGGAGHLASLLPNGYGPKVVNPWGLEGGEE